MFRPLRLAFADSVLDRLFRLRERAGDTLARTSRRRPVRLQCEPMEDRVVPSRPLPLPTVMAGAGPGMPPVVKSYDAETGKLNVQFEAYEKTFLGGVRVATADFNADTIPDIVTAPGPLGGPRVRVFDGVTGKPLAGPLGGFWAYAPVFVGGVHVAAGDVDGDGTPDVVTAAGFGGGPHVRAFSGATGKLIANFFAFDPDFHGGITVAAADLDGNLAAEIVVGAGLGGGPHVRAFTAAGTAVGGPVADFFAYEPGFRGGVWVATGDVNGDGQTDVVTGPGPNHAPRVKVWNGADGTVMSDFAAFDPDATGGVRVGTAFVTDDKYADVVAATGPGVDGRVRVFDAATGKLVTGPLADFAPFPGTDLGGVFVGAANDPGTVPTQLTFGTDPSGDLIPGQRATLTADVTPTFGGTGTPTGTVTFWLTPSGGSATVLGTAPLVPNGTNKATATYAVEDVTLPPGSHSVYADYPGDSTYIGSANTPTVYPIVTGDGPTLPTGCGGGGGGCGPNSAAVAADPAAGGGGAVPATVGKGGVRLADGVFSLTRTDLTGGGNGRPWTVDSGWTNAGGMLGGLGGNGGFNVPGDGAGGDDGFTVLFPRIAPLNGTSSFGLQPGNVQCVYPIDANGSGYTRRYGGATTLAHDTTAHEYVATDGVGNRFRFYDDFFSTPAGRVGQLKAVETAGGSTFTVASYDGDGRPTEVQRVEGSGGSAVTESFVYAFGTSGAGDDKVTSVTLRRKVGTGSWSTVRTVEYGYHDGTTGAGLSGDLRLAVVKDGSGNAIDTSYYRYYTANTSVGYTHGLKYAFGPAAYGRLTGALGTSVDSLTDGQVDDYADHYLEFDSSKRVTKHVAAGEGCSMCSGGQGEYTYTYSSNSGLARANRWGTKVVETAPDGNTTTTYLNVFGQAMLEVYEDAGTSAEWLTYHRYDTTGRLVLTAMPSAVTGYNDTYGDLLNDQGGNLQYLSDTAGLIATTEYAATTTATSSTAGDVAGFVKSTAIRQGETGTDVPQGAMNYIERTDAAGVDVYVPAASTVYRNDNGTGGQTTSVAYTWQGGTAQPASVTTTLPTVTTAQNGPNAAVSVVTVFDTHGRPVWAKDGDGFLTYTAYDTATGAVVKMIQDVDTTQTTTFANLPSGWTTPGGGGLHLTTEFERDDQGRATRTTYPNGRIDYAVFDDDNLSVRYYPGWDTGTNSPTGPTTVVQEDRAGSYTEILTMSATAAHSGGRPTGAESVGSLQSLSRVYRNAAGQTAFSDVYFDLTGLTYSTSTSLGTSGTHFYRTTTDHGKLGQVNRRISPQGTIYRTEYDGLGRPTSEWVGTDDTPTTGFWSVTNLTGTNMVKVREYEYDGGGVGNSNITETTEIPGGSAANRVTQSWFDWRDRPVAVKMGVESSEATDVNRPLTYTDFDNLGQMTKVRTYDADTVTPTVTSGVPQPLSSSLLRKQTTADYDEWGRAYKQSVHSVDPSSGSVGSYALHADTWFDKRGNVLKSAAPGGLVTKTAYDGAGRVVMVSSTDGGGDGGWADADDVSGDAVLEQMETTFDVSGNVLKSVVRQRFHDETGTGALGTPSTGVKARVSAVGYYYDKADRLTHAVNVGTNGGSAWTRPGSVPSRSDTELVTSTTYDIAGRVYEFTDPRGLVTRTSYDALGRTTKTVENYVNGTVSDTDDKTTEYTYNAAGMTSLTAKLTGGGGQTTEWVYGVTTGGGSGVTSNDVVGATYWPDPTTGAAASGEDDAVTVNALGQSLTAADRNGSVHTYTYDVLGRRTADAVTTLGNGVDGTVRRIATAYDGQGNAHLVTSYDAATSGSVVNQVQRAYNGLGQVTAEYQAVSGTVNTSTTPKVQYAYSEMPSGANHSRLTSMTYPGGWVLSYDYGTGGGLNDAISRLTALKDGSTTVEGYAYLGLGTVVKRTHPEASADLTYVKLSGESNGAAGDQYTGLDPFGRVADQRWVDGSGNALDREQYGYDRDGNRLYADNLLNNSFDELYHANGASAGYDGLNQLSAFRRGALSDANSDGVPDTISTATRTQVWTPDAVGNFADVTTDGTGQTRTHNRQNEITAVSGATTPTYDANGNLTADQTGTTYAYDAWGRTIKVNGTTRYGYDGLNRRVKEGSRTLYYTANWQVAEERASGAAVVRNVWSSVYIDALVLRDRDTDTNGSLEERLYALQDGNWNVQALVDTGGNVVERYVYEPFGAGIVYSPTYAVRLSGSVYDWAQGFQGMFFDGGPGFYKSRNRDGYSPTLSRWLQPDPSGLVPDSNHYRFVGNEPVNWTDPSGLDRYIIGGKISGDPSDHSRLAVDIWELVDGKYVKVGVATYELGRTTCGCRPITGLNNILAALGISVDYVDIIRTDGLHLTPVSGSGPDKEHKVIPSGPEADIALRDRLERDVANGAYLNGFFNQCHLWVWRRSDTGLENDPDYIAKKQAEEKAKQDGAEEHRRRYEEAQRRAEEERKRRGIVLPGRFR